MSRIKIVTVIMISASLLVSCAKVQVQDTTDGDTNYSAEEELSDYTWDESGIVNIQLNGTSAASDGKGVAINGSKVTIAASGTYRLSGSLTDGQIIVNSDDSGAVRVILNNVNITCSSSSPIYVKDAGKALIVLEENTSNYLTDGTSYTFDDAADMEPNSPLFSKSYISFYGKGSLTVDGNYGDGIVGKDGLVIKSGTISVTSVDDGIRGKDYIVVHSGNITINSGGDGMKSDNENDAKMGFITIDDGGFSITTSAGDAVDAFTDLSILDGDINITTGGGAVISTGTGGGGNPGGPPPGGSSGGYSGTVSEKGLKANGNLTIEKGTIQINSADDGIHSGQQVTISDGSVSVASGDDGIHVDGSFTINRGTLNITKSYEGIEGPALTINDGNVSVVSVDDGLNATKGTARESNDGSNVYINGGKVAINSSTGDGLDSNGNATVKGGTVIVHGPQSAPEVGFDINGTFGISGGLFVATGPNSGNMIEVPAGSSTQYSVKVTMSSSLSSSTLFHIEDADGNNIVTFKPVRSVYYIVVSSPDLKSGSANSIYTGGSSSGTVENGLYSGGTYSGGTLRKSFTVSSRTVSISF